MVITWLVYDYDTTGESKSTTSEPWRPDSARGICIYLGHTGAIPENLITVDIKCHTQIRFQLQPPSLPQSVFFFIFYQIYIS